MEDPATLEKNERIRKEFEEELAKMYGKIDNDSFVDNEIVAGADLAALPEYERSFGEMINEMFAKLPGEVRWMEGAESHETYEMSVKALYGDIQKTDVHATSGIESNGAATENLVAGQPSVHPPEQAGEALCDGGDGAATRTDMVGDVSSIQATGE
jgi:hypothetical protein